MPARLAALLAAITAWAAIQGSAPGTAQEGYRVAIDANLDNGVCNTIDAAISVPRGEDFRVAVCLLNPAEPPDAFQLHLRFDADRLSGPEQPDVAPGLDDNPDANAGATTYGDEILGEGWDCTTFGVQFPVMDSQRSESADPLMTCNANIANPDTQLRTRGAMAVLTFTAASEGEAKIELLPDVEIAGESRTVYTCGEIPAQTVRCEGARIFIGQEVPEEFQPTPSSVQVTPGAGQATPGAGVTPSNPETATAVAATVAAGGGTPAGGSEVDGTSTAGETPRPDATRDSDGSASPDSDKDDGGAGTWLVIGLIVAAVAIAAAGGWWWYVRRR